MSKQTDPQSSTPKDSVDPPATSQPPIVQGIIDELRGRPGQKDDTKGPPPGPIHPPQPDKVSEEQPAELDQDPGGGYNPDHTYPQR